MAPNPTMGTALATKSVRRAAALGRAGAPILLEGGAVSAACPSHTDEAAVEAVSRAEADAVECCCFLVALLLVLLRVAAIVIVVLGPVLVVDGWLVVVLRVVALEETKHR